MPSWERAPASLSLVEALANAPEAFRAALRWFHDRRGTEVGWPSPSPVPELPYVVTSAKGIFKPAGYSLALTVRQALKSTYADRRPIETEDGRWAYAYHQEGLDPAARDADFTNKALMENARRRIPVAVLIQTRAKPPVRYLVQGLALVTRWEDGYFYMEGFGSDETAHTGGTRAADLVIRADASALIEKDPQAAPFDPAYDARVRAVGAITRRQGQGPFRQALLRAYDGRCAITGCNVSEVLDAAHVLPYRGAHTNVTSNGLLLRTDVHTLFDTGLIAIEPGARTVVVARRLRGTAYEGLHRAPVSEPANPADRPTSEVLRTHLQWCADRLVDAP